MRENCNTAIIGDRVVLVPYRESMVETYHAWMVSIWVYDCTGLTPCWTRMKSCEACLAGGCSPAGEHSI